MPKKDPVTPADVRRIAEECIAEACREGGHIYEQIGNAARALFERRLTQLARSTGNLVMDGRLRILRSGDDVVGARINEHSVAKMLSYHFNDRDKVTVILLPNSAEGDDQP